MINNKKCCLNKIIIYDLLNQCKLTLILFVTIFVSAIMTVNTTYYTRLLTSQLEQMIIEKNILDIEWRNLILEKRTLENNTRLEYIATEKLKMQYINLSEANILIN